jgi:O-acetyl-ADP-ribose deacetylase (regulator of RNase III)
MSDVKSRMEVAEGDITKLDVDAIVNAANERLAPGGGVCGAIHRAAGLGLAAACIDIGSCPTGQARLTPGFDLKARYIIHAVGPVWDGGRRGEEELLASAYRASLEIAEAQGIETIAFPAISTGIYAFPFAAATRIAVKTVAEFMRTHALPKRVIFSCFSDDVAALYRKVLGELG